MKPYTDAYVYCQSCSFQGLTLILGCVLWTASLVVSPSCFSIPLAEEQITSFNQENESLGVQIIHNFDPEQITTLVVGCSAIDHTTHFHGRAYRYPADEPNDKQRGTHFASSRSEVEPLVKFKKNHDGTFKVIFHYAPMSAPEVLFSSMKKAVIAGKTFDLLEDYQPYRRMKAFETDSYDEAISYFSSPLGGVRWKAEVLLWEVDPQKALFLNGNSAAENSSNHLLGKLKDFVLPSFLKPFDRIIIEHSSGLTHDSLHEIAGSIFDLLKEGGKCLVELPLASLDSHLLPDSQIAIPPSVEYLPTEANQLKGIPTRDQKRLVADPSFPELQNPAENAEKKARLIKEVKDLGFSVRIIEPLAASSSSVVSSLFALELTKKTLTSFRGRKSSD